MSDTCILAGVDFGQQLNKKNFLYHPAELLSSTLLEVADNHSLLKALPCVIIASSWFCRIHRWSA